MSRTFPGHVLKFDWTCSGNSVENSRKCHGIFVDISWKFHGHFVQEISWTFQDTFLDISRSFPVLVSGSVCACLRVRMTNSSSCFSALISSCLVVSGRTSRRGKQSCSLHTGELADRMRPCRGKAHRAPTQDTECCWYRCSTACLVAARHRVLDLVP